MPRWQLFILLFSFALAVGGGVFYVRDGSNPAWWIGMLLCVPLVASMALFLTRHAKDGEHFSGSEGPWWSP